tara:strand:- start:22506 stop:22721 length:216 start_codon:yes stop_codon:yes gene_type:complete
MFSYDDGVLAEVLWEELATTKRTVIDLRSQLYVAQKTVEELQAINEDLHMMSHAEEGNTTPPVEQPLENDD